MASRHIHRVCESVYRVAGIPGECAYCGERADTVEHVVPRSFVAGNLGLIAKCDLFKVPACMDCNNHAGSVLDLTFIDRRRRIAAAVRRKNLSILAEPGWDEDEIAAMGRGMRESIRAAASRKRRLILRLEALAGDALPPGVRLDLLPTSALRASTEAEAA